MKALRSILWICLFFSVVGCEKYEDPDHKFSVGDQVCHITNKDVLMVVNTCRGLGDDPIYDCSWVDGNGNMNSSTISERNLLFFSESHDIGD